jgi:hypothetical protein
MPTSGYLLNGDLGSPSWMRFLRITEVFHGSCVLNKARSDSNARTRFLNLFPSFGGRAFRRKRTCFEKSATFGFLNVLREASPLAAFRRKRTCFRPSASSRRKGVLRFLRLPSESFTSGGVAAFRRKRTSFGKLHLWRLSEGSERPSGSFTSGSFLNVLREASPLADSFGKLHLWRLPSESFTSGGFPKDVYPSGRRPPLEERRKVPHDHGDQRSPSTRT